MGLLRLRFVTAGESHGPGLTAILDGLPAGLQLSRDRLREQMRRRQAGYGRGARMKIETDEVEITGGLRFGKTIGSPVSFWIANRDFKNWEDVMAPWGEPVEKKQVTRPRPGHADLPGGLKYDDHELRNILERASARETAARTAAGAVCMQLLQQVGIEIASHVTAIGGIRIPKEVTWEQITAVQGSEVLRCVHPETEQKMVQRIDEAKSNKETLGGEFEVVAHNVLPGLGSHVQWDRKIDGRLAQAVMSIPSVKGVAIGDAFAISARPGSEAHDEILYQPGKGFDRTTNRAGGTEGGITNGQDIRVRAAMKPLSTLMKPLKSVDIVSKEATEAVVERSDVCAVPAGGVVGEAMVALVLAEALLEKFSSDSMRELLAAVSTYRKQLENY